MIDFDVEIHEKYFEKIERLKRANSVNKREWHQGKNLVDFFC